MEKIRRLENSETQNYFRYGKLGYVGLINFVVWGKSLNLCSCMYITVVFPILFNSRNDKYTITSYYWQIENSGQMQIMSLYAIHNIIVIYTTYYTYLKHNGFKVLLQILIVVPTTQI